MPVFSKDLVVSLTAAGANLATVLAMDEKRSHHGEQREQREQQRERARSSSFNVGHSMFANSDGGFSRQATEVTPCPELGRNIFVEATPSGHKSKPEFFIKGDESVKGDNFGSDMAINATKEEMMAMRSVFKRLCTSSKEVISIEDVIRVHNFLGEPIQDDEKKMMTEFFGLTSTSDQQVSFDMFMRWWCKLHDSAADPDEYYSKERYRQRFKVLHSRLKDTNIASIQAIGSGERDSRRFRVHFESEGNRLSPWHDIPLRNPDGTYNFICEIPKWTRKKYEIATGEPMNPIKQDVKNGELREYKWGDMLFNYGAFPQTWEDPKHVSEETDCGGDNDPIDVIELGTRQRPLGSITRVKILGVIAMIDSGETDWKILAIAEDDDKAVNIQDLNDLDAHMPGVTDALTNWLRMYKTAEGKPESKFGMGAKPQGAAFARRIVDECHESWRALLREQSQSGSLQRDLTDGRRMSATNLTV